MIFYIDLIFLENIIMNYIILFATGLIIKDDLKHIRIFLSSTIGAIYAIMSYISGLEIYKNQVVKFLLSVVMTYIAFNPKNIKKMCKNIVISIYYIILALNKLEILTEF
jgi:stage II sporulation protein GA (sporulation sigma-E factor processing peptidase)